jgi:formylglycine-generating enzyme required for sulfatase activity
MGSPESDSLAFQDEFPEHEVTVSTYELDKYEVTVGRFRAFVEGWDYRPPPPGAGAHPRIAGSGWRSAWDKRLPQSRVVLENGLNCPVATWPMGTDVLPMNCVTWYEAFTFCVWDGGRLPTEAEWEYAAAGGDENRKYPWGQDTPDPDVHAVHDCAYGGTPRNCDKFDVRAPVGSKPLGAGRWGHDDLAGSMFEWVLDAYDTYDTAIVCNDCANASDVLIRLLRGGSWSTLDQYVRATYRYYSAPTYRYSGVGFRCARNP